MKKVTIFSDGGARGNPGPAGIGATIEINDGVKTERFEVSEFIGDATNNQAEYKAIISALNLLKQKALSDLEHVECFLDSQLVVEQLNGNYKVKNEGIKPLFAEVRDLVMALGGKVSFTHVMRELNKQADRLVNEAIDKNLIA